MKRDLHLHTYCSDGYYEVETVIEKAKKQGLEQISITDHDTIDGINRAKHYAKGMLEYITGIEFTCQDEVFQGEKEAYCIHLLGYGFDEENSKLKERLNQRRMEVEDCYKALLNELKIYGMDCSLEEIPISCGIVMQLRDIQAYLSNTFSEHPKLADAKEKVESYAKKLAEINIPVKEAIDFIHHAGGKAVWAHPFCVYQMFQKTTIPFTTVQRLLKLLIEMGLDGMEANYLDFSEQERELLREEAKKRKLMITAGSDFHGRSGRDRMIE